VEVSLDRSRGLLSRFDDPASVGRWRGWIDKAVQESRRSGIALVVVKESHRLEVYRNGQVARYMLVDLGAYSLRQKSYAGDRTTPEGCYRITGKKGFGQTGGAFRRRRRATSCPEEAGSAGSSKSTARAAAARTGPTGA